MAPSGQLSRFVGFHFDFGAQKRSPVPGYLVVQSPPGTWFLTGSVFAASTCASLGQETLDQDRRAYLVFPVVESDHPSVLTPLAANLAPMRQSIIENPALGLAIVSRGIE